MVEAHLDGSIHLTYQGKSLKYDEVLSLPKKAVQGKPFLGYPIRMKNKNVPTNHP